MRVGSGRHRKIRKRTRRHCPPRGGHVTEKSKHPDADRLSLTKVDVGTGRLLDIVCGAPNVEAGQKVIVATEGTVPYPTEGEPFTIKKSKIRGQASEGMICAEDEIGLGKSHEGIRVLRAELPVGMPVADYFRQRWTIRSKSTSRPTVPMRLRIWEPRATS